MLAIRVVLILVLLGLIVRPPLARSGLATVVQLDSVDDAPGYGSRLIVRRGTEPPSAAELERIATLGGPLLAALPTPGTVLDAIAPRRPLENRATQVAWRLRGAQGATGTLRVSDAGGVLDSASVMLPSDGIASGAFRVVPARAGWQEWTVAWDRATASVGSWVLPARPLRALVVAGPGSVEGRDVTRVLEGGGAQVTLAEALGRGLRLGDAPAGVPAATQTLAAYDIVLVLGVPLTPPQVAALEAYAADGGGVLGSGISGAALPIAGGAARDEFQVPASGIVWETPAEVPALPAAEVGSSAIPLAPAGPVTRVAARASGSDLLLLAPVGRGRMAALALQDTWKWGLQAGRGAELSAFWLGLAEWLAAGTPPLAIVLDPESAAPGSTISLEVARLDNSAARPLSVTLTRPSGGTESLPLAWVGDHAHASFVMDANGPFVAALDDANAVAAITTAPSPAPAAAASPPDAWARLALLANANGGQVVPAAELNAAVDRLAPDETRRLPAVFWLALVLTLALAEWTVRRLRGLV